MFEFQNKLVAETVHKYISRQTCLVQQRYLKTIEVKKIEKNGILIFSNDK